jgi:FkbM family methyltransferase
MSIINLAEWIKAKYGIPVRGILHVGANKGQEAEEYDRAGWRVVWIEGDPELYNQLQETIFPYPRQSAFCCLCSDVGGRSVPFYRASNAGGSSSILKPNEPVFKSFKVSIKECIELPVRRLDELVGTEKVNLEGLNLINLDVQGYELPVLKGLGSLLEKFDIVLSELNWSKAYEECTKPIELERLLAGNGLRRVFTSVGFPQGSAVWVRMTMDCSTKVFLAASLRLTQTMSDLGVFRILQNSRTRSLLRKGYYRLIGRPCQD